MTNENMTIAEYRKQHDIARKAIRAAVQSIADSFARETAEWLTSIEVGFVDVTSFGDIRVRTEVRQVSITTSLEI